MSEDLGSPARRLRAVRPDAVDVPSPATGPVHETAESVLPGLPRIGALDALLREVDGLRLTLETDLSLAAAAVEAGAAHVAGDIIDGDRASLRLFESRALDHLADLSDADLSGVPAVRRRRWRVPAAPFVAAAAVVGFLVGVVPQFDGQQPTQVSAANASANASLIRITELAANGQMNEVRTAAADLHSQLLSILERAKSDRAAANTALIMLSQERLAIAQSGDSQALGDVLAASTSLTNRINRILLALPANVRPTVTAVPVAAPTVQPSTQPSPQPSTKASSKPTSKPSSKPKSSSSPAPSGSPGGVLPTSPAIGP